MMLKRRNRNTMMTTRWQRALARAAVVLPVCDSIEEQAEQSKKEEKWLVMEETKTKKYKE